ncbi:carbohydrate ABC transporter permease [Deinococcus sp.]|uniref:carbohydrate ABC transporter permease n=1 Tax=Deinococcus sp. TaxID=47478 RepID=UPI003B59131E
MSLPAPAPRQTRSQRTPWYQKDAAVGYLFILPSIIGLLTFVLYPLCASAYYALTDWNGVTPPIFVGFKNFRYLLTQSPAFWPSLRATGLYVLMVVPGSLILGLALLLNRNVPGIRLFRTIFYLPAVLPIVATLTLWKFIYNPDYGLANQVLHFFGLPGAAWLSSPNLALPALVVIGLWGVGSTMIIFLAALQGVPKELYEAARIDGASPWRMLLGITLPVISPILFLQFIMQIIAALQQFNAPQVLTQGGPGFATNLLMYQIYKTGFVDQQQGLASAEVWVLFVLIVLVTLLTFRFSSMWVYAENEIG